MLNNYIVAYSNNGLTVVSRDKYNPISYDPITDAETQEEAQEKLQYIVNLGIQKYYDELAPLDNSFANRIKLFRTMQGLTQKQLSQLSGVNKSQIAEYEANKQKPDFKDFCKIMQSFSFKLDIDKIKMMYKKAVVTSAKQEMEEYFKNETNLRA